MLSNHLYRVFNIFIREHKKLVLPALNIYFGCIIPYDIVNHSLDNFSCIFYNFCQVLFKVFVFNIVGFQYFIC
ncbi:hypothetical protein [Sulfolobus tengchongensis spindle-shaped virus 3]|nr:hypothetical protein [Sulfolobus tengchongensis spindle-shaped virus 3]